jgi:hypothetical protein
MKTESQAPIGSPQNKFEASNKSSFQCFFYLIRISRVGPMGGGGRCFSDKISGGGGKHTIFGFIAFLLTSFSKICRGPPLFIHPCCGHLCSHLNVNYLTTISFSKIYRGGGPYLTTMGCRDCRVFVEEDPSTVMLFVTFDWNLARNKLI